MAFGARVLKTGIAVTLALFLSTLLNTHSPVGAAIAAIFAMQPSIYRSWRYFLDQLQTSTLGAIMALLGGMVFSNEPIAVGLVCVLVLMICLKINMADTVGLTLVTVVSVMEASGDWKFAVTRFALTLIGIVSAFVINVSVFPRNRKGSLLIRFKMYLTACPCCCVLPFPMRLRSLSLKRKKEIWREPLNRCRTNIICSRKSRRSSSAPSLVKRDKW